MICIKDFRIKIWKNSKKWNKKWNKKEKKKNIDKKNKHKMN